MRAHAIGTLLRRVLRRFLGKVACHVISCQITESQGKFLRVRRGCQASQRRADLRGKSAKLPGKSGELPGKSGKLPGTPGLLLSSTARELPGKSPKNFRGSLGNFRGSPGTSQKLGGARHPPSDSSNLSPRKYDKLAHHNQSPNNS